MSFQGWLVFATFWALFVTTPGPNAVNCIANGMTHGFTRSLWGVAGILTQATAFLLLSAVGVTALIAASPSAFFWGRLLGAAMLIWLGIRGWRAAARPVRRDARRGGLYFKALMIATINVKSVAGYLAAFSQFVEPSVLIWTQMQAILPTALTLTALSYCAYTALGAGLGRLAMGAVLNVGFRRVMAMCFIGYGLALAALGLPELRRG